MINATKKSLRTFYRNVRAQVIDRTNKNETIAEQLINSLQYKNADSIFAYWSVGSEVDTLKIIEKALRDSKKIALPKCTDENGNMTFFYLPSLDYLVDGMYGIKEPCEDYIADDFTNTSLCIVPALSFDRCGYRLGYGKGYYDKFLSSFSGITVGLCYEECLCDELPRDSYDKKVNYIITNDKIYDLR